MLSFLRSLVGRFRRDQASETLVSANDELAWLSPPTDVQDPTAWDKYWNDQVSHGLGPGLFDMFIDDEKLVQTMLDYGLTTVLCAGNGISLEPRALAEAGFEVTALDFSPMALQLAQMWDVEADELVNFFRSQRRPPRGRTKFIVGDILDPMTCPGPFDIIIERRTVQNYAPEQQPGVLEALAARLGPNGIFLSHCHDAVWRPPAEPFHATKAWFRKCGWPIWPGPPKPKPEGKVAWLFTSTG